jgi:hypothetical protein
MRLGEGRNAWKGWTSRRISEMKTTPNCKHKKNGKGRDGTLPHEGCVEDARHKVKGVRIFFKEGLLPCALRLTPCAGLA